MSNNEGLVEIHQQDSTEQTEILKETHIQYHKFNSTNSIPVKFPFRPYDCQKDFIGSVIKAIDNSKNALLESPTGTGKTACLLTSVLAWLDTRHGLGTRQRVGSSEGSSIDMDNIPNHSFSSSIRQASLETGSPVSSMKSSIPTDAKPQIFYTTRTHSQIAQVIKELKRLDYNPKICVLGSRDHFCVNPQVMKLPSSTKSSVCRRLLSKRQCFYHRNVDKNINIFETKLGSIEDIEDIGQFGKSHGACPYYLTRGSIETADIVFLPYNYVVDTFTRESQKINLTNSIIIFDEGHNLESSCSETSSFDISTVELANFCSDLEQIVREMEKGVVIDATVSSTKGSFSTEKQSLSPQDFRQMKRKVNTLIKEINDIKLSDPNSSVFNSKMIYDILEKVDIKSESVDDILSLLEAGIGTVGSVHSNRLVHLSKFVSILRILFRTVTKKEGVKQSFKLHIREIMDNRNNSKIKVRELGFWCFDSGIVMRNIAQDARSIIVASGTLAPINSFAWELGIKFDVFLENPHVIDKSQVLVAALQNGPNGNKLSSSFENRTRVDYVYDLGNTIANFVRTVPDGVLVFFPSYGTLEFCVDKWKIPVKGAKESIWDRISRLKEPIVEPRFKDEFDDAMDTYFRQLKNPYKQGSIFFAVCRGKISEGIDFSDQKGRAVVICGIPYPAAMDPKVKLKKQYLDTLYQSRKGQDTHAIQGYEWYRQQASRAVNQALGRVIRHRYDYGAILLCDERFTSQSSINQLPLWLRSQLIKIDKFPKLHVTLTKFFKNMENTMPELVRNAKAEVDTSMVTSSKIIGKKKLSEETALYSEGSEVQDIDKLLSLEVNVKKEFEERQYESVGEKTSVFNTSEYLKYIVNNSQGLNSRQSYKFSFNNGSSTEKTVANKVQNILSNSVIYSPSENRPKTNNNKKPFKSSSYNRSNSQNYDGTNGSTQTFLDRRNDERILDRSLGHVTTDVIKYREQLAKKFAKNAQNARKHSLGVSSTENINYKPTLFAANGKPSTLGNETVAVSIGSIVAQDTKKVLAKADNEIKRADREVENELIRKKRKREEKTNDQVDADIHKLVRKYGIETEEEIKLDKEKKKQIVSNRSGGWGALRKKLNSNK